MWSWLEMLGSLLGGGGEHSGFFLSQLKLVGFELCAKGSNGDPGPPWM